METINEIAIKIKNVGGCLYLVGGAIRDSLLGKSIHDEDYCVTGITDEQFKEIFPEANIRGKAFSVFDINGKEFALARKEIKIGKGHKEFKIKTDSQITIEDDLARRDITINSIAKNILTGEIIDPFNGREDLKNKIIRATTLHFKEDPLRVYRVARFAAQFGFSVENSTIKQMYELKNELETLSKERVFTELKKALETEKPSIFFDTLKQAKVLDVHFKEINDLIGVEQPIKYHPEGDAYNHSMLVLDMASSLTDSFEKNRKLEIRYSALVHDLGKGLTPTEEYPHHYGHEDSGIKPIKNISKKIGVPNAWLKCAKISCKEHMRGGIFYKMSTAKKVEFFERVGKTILGLDGLQIIVISDKTSGGRQTDIKSINFADIGKQCLNEINGKYIKDKYNIKQGINFGKILHNERVKWLKNLEKTLTV